MITNIRIDIYKFGRIFMVMTTAPEFRGGLNVAMKLPKAQFDRTVAFYRDVLGLEVADESGPHVVTAVPRCASLRFGPVTLWLDQVDNYAGPTCGSRSSPTTSTPPSATSASTASPSRTSWSHSPTDRPATGSPTRRASRTCSARTPS